MPDTLYVTAEEVKAQLSLSGSDFADGEVQDAVDAACRGVDAVCRRRFYADDEIVARRYTPNPPDLLEIDDLTDLEDITVTYAGDDWVEGTDYVLLPLNAPADGRPYEYLKILNRISSQPDDGSLVVSGIFGWPAVPAGARTQAKILAGKLLIRMRQAPLGIVVGGMDQSVAVQIARTDPDMFLNLKNLTRTKTRSLELG